jgi:acyl-CoA synthetase (AMP-forming)/AMP-acid ligase II
MIQLAENLAKSRGRSASAAEPEVATLLAALTRANSEGAKPYVNLIERGGVKPLGYADVERGARRVAAHLITRGVQPGERVALLLPSGESFILALFGTQMAGAIPVPWPLPASLGSVDSYVHNFFPVLEHADVAALITTGSAEDSARALMRKLGRESGLILADALDADPPTVELPDVSPDDVALIQFTSGRVHDPMGVVLTHRQVLSNVHATGVALQLGPDDVGLTWVPLVHDMGLVGALYTSLYWRYPTYVMPPAAFLMRPHSWLANLSKFGATISAAPNFAYGLCVSRVKDRHLEGVDLSRWRLALNGSETVCPRTVEAFSERFAPVGFDRRAMFPLYGLAENTLAVTCPTLSDTYRTHRLGEKDIVSVGYPVAGQEVCVAAPCGSILPEEEVGEILVKSPSTMNGYFRQEDETERALTGGWLHTGDLGFMVGGRLHITGRSKHMVIKMGRNFFPSDIERAVRHSDGLRVNDVVAFAQPNDVVGTEDLVVVVELGSFTDDSDAVEKRLRVDLVRRLGLRPDHIVLAPAGSFPKGAGRDAHRAAARQIAAGARA